MCSNEPNPLFKSALPLGYFRKTFSETSPAIMETKISLLPLIEKL